MSCSYQTITLSAGEQFVLPPGATIIAATDTNLISSQNDCAGDLQNLEEFTCYSFRFSGALSDDDGRTENWDDQNFYVNGITIQGVYYPFTSSIQGWQGATSFETALNGITALSGLFNSVANNFGYDSVFLGASRGWTNVVTLNTIPSIGDVLEFNVSTVTIDQTVVPDGSSSFATIAGEPCSIG
jgi:hypothetical protein